MTKPIDWVKPVIDHAGNEVRVLCTDRPNVMYPVVAMDRNGRLAVFTSDGRCFNSPLISLPSATPQPSTRGG